MLYKEQTKPVEPDQASKTAELQKAFKTRAEEMQQKRREHANDNNDPERLGPPNISTEDQLGGDKVHQDDRGKSVALKVPEMEPRIRCVWCFTGYKYPMDVEFGKSWFSLAKAGDFRMDDKRPSAKRGRLEPSTFEAEAIGCAEVDIYIQETRLKNETNSPTIDNEKKVSFSEPTVSLRSIYHGHAAPRSPFRSGLLLCGDEPEKFLMKTCGTANLQ